MGVTKQKESLQNNLNWKDSVVLNGLKQKL